MNAPIGVIGGGPAGVSVALRLAQLGLPVVLLEKRLFPRRHIGESLTPGVFSLLDVLGVRQEVEQQNFLRQARALVYWPPDQGHKVLGSVSGFQVERGRFDALLLSLAAQRGVVVIQGASIETVRQTRHGWTLDLRRQGQSSLLHCRFLVDASGRKSSVPAKVRVAYGIPTLALCACWDGIDLPSDEMRLEAGENEWFWGAPLSKSTWSSIAFIDAKRLKPANKPVRPDELYLSLLERSELLKPCLAGKLLGRVRVCDSTCYLDPQPVTSRLIRVGEASLSIDPLSSQGVQLAISSGLHAAVAVHTMIRRPETSHIAQQFYRERQLEACAFHSSAAAKFYAQAARDRPHSFWQSRARGQFNSSFPPQPPSRPLLSNIKLRLGAESKIVRVPCVKNDFIEMTSALFHPRLLKQIAFLGNVALDPLLGCLDVSQTAGDLLRIWSELIPPALARQILGWLWDNGLLSEA